MGLLRDDLDHLSACLHTGAATRPGRFGLRFWLTVPVHRPSLDWWVERRVGVPPMKANILSGGPPSRKSAQAVIVGAPGWVTEDLVRGQDFL